MNRFWIGVLIAVLLGTFGIAADRYGKRQSETIASLLTQCAEAADAEDWQQAKVYAHRAEAVWNDWEPFARALYPGTALTPLDRLIAALPSLIETENRMDLPVRCAEEIRMLIHIRYGT